MESLTHGLYAVLWTRVSRFSSLLCDSSSTANSLTLKAFNRCNEILIVACQPSNTVACHSVCLADTIDDDEAIFEFWELRECLVLTCIEDMLVDLVGQYIHLWVAFEHLHECLEVL